MWGLKITFGRSQSSFSGDKGSASKTSSPAPAIQPSLINVARVEEALERQAETVCVCCPYCMTMFDDGLKDKEADEKVRVLDLAEIVARALPDE